MRAVADADRAPLERWAAMHEAEVAVVWDAHLGGRPVAMIGIESRPLPRFGSVPADGPEQWTSGTLFPQASKKVARAINAASGRRPLVILANLAGFDGSPESMRRLQLEYGAEIGRAIVNFDGPIAFCVISRFHGGAFVVFSRRLNPGARDDRARGLARLGDRRRARPPRSCSRARSTTARARMRGSPTGPRTRRSTPRCGPRSWASWRPSSTPSTASSRAVEVGSVDRIISAAELRPHLIEAVERGIERTLAAVQPVAVGSAQ